MTNFANATIPTDESSTINDVDVENQIFSKSKIPHNILSEQCSCAHDFIALFQKEKEINPKRMIQQGGLLSRIKERKDQVIALASNATVPHSWNLEKDKNISPLGVETLIAKEPFLYVSGLVTIVSTQGIAVRKFIEKLHAENIMIQDVFSTLSLVMAYEKQTGTSAYAREKTPQKIMCLAKYGSIKKNADLLHLFNFFEGVYRNSVIDSNSIIDTGVTIPVFFPFREVAKI